MDGGILPGQAGLFGLAFGEGVRHGQRRLGLLVAGGGLAVAVGELLGVHPVVEAPRGSRGRSLEPERLVVRAP